MSEGMDSGTSVSSVISFGTANGAKPEDAIVVVIELVSDGGAERVFMSTSWLPGRCAGIIWLCSAVTTSRCLWSFATFADCYCCRFPLPLSHL